MIVVNARAHAKCLNFPNACTLLLPEIKEEGERFPFIFCLHDLGEDRWQCIRKARLEKLAEKYGVALVIPDGRRSCFLNMAHGPRWNDYLMQDLSEQLRSTFPLKDSMGVAGAGTGALGALALARRGVPCTLVEPKLRDAVTCDSSRWPREAEWRGVFDGLGRQLQQSCWQGIKGVIVGSSASLDCAEELMGLSHWKKICCEEKIERKWEAALVELTEQMGAKRRTPLERT